MLISNISNRQLTQFFFQFRLTLVVTYMLNLSYRGYLSVYAITSAAAVHKNTLTGQRPASCVQNTMIRVEIDI